MNEVERNKCAILIMQELVRIGDDDLIDYMKDLIKNEPKSV